MDFVKKWCERLNNWFVQIAEVTEHLSLTLEHENSHSKIQCAEEFCLRLWYEWTKSSPEKDISSVFKWACKIWELVYYSKQAVFHVVKFFLFCCIISTFSQTDTISFLIPTYCSVFSSVNFVTVQLGLKSTTESIHGSSWKSSTQVHWKSTQESWKELPG